MNGSSPTTNRSARQHRRRIFAAGVLSCTAIIAITTAAFASADESRPSTTPTTTGSVRRSTGSDGKETCNFHATLFHGRKATTAAATALQRPETTIRYAGATIAVSTDGDDVEVGARIDSDLYVLIAANRTRTDEVIDLIKDAIDDHETLSGDTGDATFTFSGNHCDLAAAADEDLAINDVLRSDITLGFQDDETTCDLTSLFSSSGRDETFNLGDVNLGDVNLGDLDLDVDFQNSDDDGGFAIGLDTVHGTIGLKCATKPR